MSDIQRYRVGPDYLVPAHEDDNGPWVTYADHVAAVAAAEQRVLLESADWTEQDHYKAGVQAARDAVAALMSDPYICAEDIGRALAAIDALTTRDEGRNTG